MASKQYVIVVGTDHSSHGSRAVRAAAREAAKHLQARLHVVHVLPGLRSLNQLPPISFAGFASSHAQGEHDVELNKLDEHVAAALAHLELPSALQIETHVLAGDPEFVLVEVASQLCANILVVGTRGRQYTSRWALGSVAESVARYARCAVLVIGPRAPLSAEHLDKSAPS